MKLLEEDFKTIEEIAIQAAIEAGKVIMEYKTKGFKVLEKDAGSSAASMALTEVDALSENIIISNIEPLIKKYDLGLLAEESPDDLSRLTKDYFFAIDPLDGTKSFIDKTSGFAVSIALISKSGEPVVGVVYDPVEKSIYNSIKNGVVKKNGEVLKQSEKNTLDRVIVVDPGYNPIRENNITYINYRGAVINAIKVLEGEFDEYIKPPKEKPGGGSIWDFAATALFFINLGLQVSAYNGAILNLNDSKTTYMNRQGVIFKS